MNTVVRYEVRSDKLKREMEKILERSSHSGAFREFKLRGAAKEKAKVDKPRKRKRVAAA